MTGKDLRNKITLIDEAKVIKVRKSMPFKDDILDLSDSFKMLGDSTRLKILFALKNEEQSAPCPPQYLPETWRR